MVLDMAADGGSSVVKMVVSYGGQMMRCSNTGKVRYAGGENRVVRVGMSERLSELRARLAALAGYSDVRIQYAVAGGGLAGDGGGGLDYTLLHDVTDDHDLWVLVTRLCCCNGLASGSRDGGRRIRAFLSPITTLPMAHQSAMAVSSTCTAASSMAALSSDEEGSATQVDSGFEALAEIAAAQRSATGNAAGVAPTSSVTSSSSGVATSTGQQADSGFDALAAIAAAQSSATTTMTTTTECTARGAATCVAQQADSGLEALTTVAVAGQQRVQVFPPPPPATAVGVFLVVPVAPVAVFFHAIAIPVYGCLIPTVL